MSSDDFFKRAYDDPLTPPEIPTGRPTSARIYDYFLGGKDNFEVDRAAAEQVIAAAPGTREVARENRAFLSRAVRYLAAEAGIRQFIDLGSGLPTQDNVHQVARRHGPGSRVVYVDNDPIVLAHGRAILADNGDTTVITADLRDTSAILDHPDTTDLIDFTQPWALLLVSVLHFVPDSDDPAAVIAAYRERMPAGSHLVVSHLGTGPVDEEAMDTAKRTYAQTDSGLHPRGRAEIESLFDGFQLIDPGLELVHRWRPEGTPAHLDFAAIHAGVGRL